MPNLQRHKKASPGRDQEPTDSQASSFTMEAIDVGHHCHIMNIQPLACENATRAGSEEGRLFSQASFSVRQMERFQKQNLREI